MSDLALRPPGGPLRLTFDGQSHNLVPTGAFGSPMPRYVLRGLYNSDARLSVAAITGTGWATLDDDAATRLHPIAGLADDDILVMCGGTQDILDGTTGAAIYTLMADHAAAARAAGFNHVVATTIPPATAFSGPQETERAAANAAVLADASAAFDDTVDIDVAPLDDPADTDWYADGVHWTDAGAIVAAELVLSIVLPLT